MKKSLKAVKSPNYNYIFSNKTGFFARWGKTEDDDPDFSPFGPEILDIEISTVCHQGCPWCYKSNTSEGKNMSLETFKKILAVIPQNLTQIAFGIGSIDANPDLWHIMAHTRAKGFVPNITINGARMTNNDYHALARVCGAVAVSNYGKDTCYNAVQALNEHKQMGDYVTLQQVNIHQLLAEETFDKCWHLLEDVQKDERLKGLNAVVFLLLKPKGERNVFHQLRNASSYRDFINYALDRNIRIGFDSCTAPSFLRAVKDHKDYDRLEQVAEPCESTMFSLYINVDGQVVPCSFCDGEKGMEPIDITTVKDFMKEVWFAPPLESFRNALLDSQAQHGCRQCPVFDVEIES